MFHAVLISDFAQTETRLRVLAVILGTWGKIWLNYFMWEVYLRITIIKFLGAHMELNLQVESNFIVVFLFIVKIGDQDPINQMEWWPCECHHLFWILHLRPFRCVYGFWHTCLRFFKPFTTSFSPWCQLCMWGEDNYRRNWKSNRWLRLKTCDAQLKIYTSLKI